MEIEIIISGVIIIAILIIIMSFINYKKKSKIKMLSQVLLQIKGDFISDEQLNKIKEDYKLEFQYFSKKKFKSKEVIKFLNTYVNLSNYTKKWNEEYKLKEEIQKKEKEEKEKLQKMYSLRIEASNNFLKEVEELKKEYITTKKRNEFMQKYRALFEYFQRCYSLGLVLEIPDKFLEVYKNFNKLVTNWNSEFVRNELKNNTAFFDDIDGKSLDYQQRTAVVTDDDNNLIIAGAGSGKTLTIAAKVKYLVEKKNINADEILLISFAKKAANEMTERIRDKLNIPVSAITFHKLGLDILKDYQTPKIIEDMQEIISNYFKTEVLKDYNLLKKIFDFFLFYLNVPKDLQDFDCFGSYIENQKSLDLETLKLKYNTKLMNLKIDDMKKDLHTVSGERVKSMEEVMIANYLFLNGINYEYEREYPFKSEDNPYRSYHPDFYLTDYDIYLEHFGITKNNTLPWLSKVEEKKYLAEMNWKREFHKQNGTKLIETYSYYNIENRLISELQKLLDENGVKRNPKNIREIYEKVYANDEDYHFKEFEKLINTFINLYKANGYSIDDVNKLMVPETNYKAQRNDTFLDIVSQILKYYENELKNRNGIDFNDMINLANNYIVEKNIHFNYKYIIIDEYQDISVGRYKLIKNILDHSNAKLVCVGDDWQSIYRFSGSDLDLFRNFKKYFGEYAILKIEKTYRNSQELLDIASRFIEKNPEQLKKNLLSDKRINNPIMVMSYTKNAKTALQNALTDIYVHFGEEAEVLLLGRTNYDLNDYLDNELKYFPNTNIVTYKKYPKMKLKFLTVHSSKGLEADNVIILNMKNNLLGFPNKIYDDEVLSMVLHNKDSYEYAEERRLFYVAITRTRNKTYLISPDRHASIFLDDLKKITNLNIYMNEEESTVSNPSCPKCKKGYMIIYEGEKEPFLGCSNYPYCDYTINDIDVLNNQIKCEQCGGYLVKRNGPYGEFLGCSNYPYCDNTDANNGKKIGFNN